MIYFYRTLLPALSLLILSFVSDQKSIKPSAYLKAQDKIDNVPFIPGERLDYNIHYGFINAGHATFEISGTKKKIAGENHYDINVGGHSFSYFDAIFSVRDEYESFINEKTMLPTVFIRNIHEGSYQKKENYVFIRSKNKVISSGKTFTIPPDVHDLVSTFYYLRCIDFSKQKTGVSFHMKMFFDDTVLETGLTFTGKETIKTSLGKIRCYVFRPILVKGRIFKNQNDMTLFVSEDKNQVPIRIQSWVYLDYVRADLETYKNLKYPLTALVNP